MLVTSAKFAEKAEQTLEGGLEKTPVLARTEKLVVGGQTEHEPTLEDVGDAPAQSGMMLYTSGTTNRPVCMV